MRRCHDLRLPLTSAIAQEFDEQAQAAGVNAVFNFFNRQNSRHGWLEKCRRDCRKSQGSIAEHRRGKFTSVLFQHEQRFAYRSSKRIHIINFFRPQVP